MPLLCSGLHVVLVLLDSPISVGSLSSTGVCRSGSCFSLLVGALTGALLSEKQWGALLVGRSSLGRCLCSSLGPKVFLVPSPHASCAAGSCEMEVRREGGFTTAGKFQSTRQGSFLPGSCSYRFSNKPAKKFSKEM